MVCLMAGCKFKSPYESEFFDYLLVGDLDNWLWFHLKLASFKFTERNDSMSMLSMQHELPINYKAYFMEDLVEEVMHKLTKENFMDPEMSDLRNNVNYSRVLFLIGEYQSALKELLQS